MYFAGAWREKKRHKTQDREECIRQVLHKYMEFRRTGYTAGYDGLVKAGIATLESNDEITELLGLIVAHGEADPLGSQRQTVFKGVDLLRLFKFASERRINLITTPVERVITESGARAPTD